jgi:hypothetical protein
MLITTRRINPNALEVAQILDHKIDAVLAAAM